MILISFQVVSPNRDKPLHYCHSHFCTYYTLWHHLLHLSKYRIHFWWWNLHSHSSDEKLHFRENHCKSRAPSQHALSPAPRVSLRCSENLYVILATLYEFDGATPHFYVKGETTFSWKLANFLYFSKCYVTARKQVKQHACLNPTLLYLISKLE